MLRQPQPQKLFPSALVILNILETNIVNCLRIAPSGGPSQLRLSWFIANRASGVSEMLLELEAVAQLSSVQMRFCKTSQISQKTYKMESLFVKLQAVKAATVLKRTSSLAFSCEYVHVKIFFHFYFFVSEKTKAATEHVLWRKMFHKFCKFHRNTPVLQPLFNKIAGF